MFGDITSCSMHLAAWDKQCDCNFCWRLSYRLATSRTVVVWPRVILLIQDFLFAIAGAQTLTRLYAFLALENSVTIKLTRSCAYSKAVIPFTFISSE